MGHIGLMWYHRGGPQAAEGHSAVFTKLLVFFFYVIFKVWPSFTAFLQSESTSSFMGGTRRIEFTRTN